MRVQHDPYATHGAGIFTYICPCPKSPSHVSKYSIIGSMYAIYGNIYHQYTPFMLAYIPAPWILLWVMV